jgi:hypothetical protein
MGGWHDLLAFILKWKSRSAGLDETTDFLTDLLQRRGRPTVGGNPNRWVELHGGSVVEMLAFDPDATTYRLPYYYNTVRNVLYKKSIIRSGAMPLAVWRKASNG